jgi:hypothetical protein
VFEAYWISSARTRESDRAWLARQCWKEIWGSGVASSAGGLFLGAAQGLIDVFPRIDVVAAAERHEVLRAIDSLREEFAHYCEFADVHDALALPGEPRLAPHRLVGWAEDQRLTDLRMAHKRENPALGERAARITEGGFGTLYRSGQSLVAVGGAHARANELIASACRRVLGDEWGHMAQGWRQLDDAALSPPDWERLEEMATEQMRARIDMRNAQFGQPLTREQLRDARAGRVQHSENSSLVDLEALTAR